MATPKKGGRLIIGQGGGCRALWRIDRAGTVECRNARPSWRLLARGVMLPERGPGRHRHHTGKAIQSQESGPEVEQ